MRIRIMRNVLQVSWFNNAYSHEYTLVPYMRVIGLVSRFPNTYLCEYALFLLVFTLPEGEGAAAAPQKPDHPAWYEQFQDKLAGFDTVHDLISEKLSKVDLKGMKQLPGKKGKGTATRSSKKVSNF